MVITKLILILEDNLRVLSKLLGRLHEVEQDQPYDFELMVLTSSQQVEDFVNNNSEANFDVIILDRDCKIGQSFHVLDIERFGPEKIISISTVERYNEDARARGVRRVVLKDLGDLDEFAQKVAKEVEIMVSPLRLQKLMEEKR